ncbi:MAG: protein kinase [Holophagales bacterium]|nr:protein kinase [Holophagales bacterium]
MGAVFEAEDLRLHRRVALKTLPESLAEEPEQLDRFEREARTLASLQHRNIVIIYSVEEEDGEKFLTMEWIEGRSLAQEIPEDGLPLDVFYEYALQIADALVAAHARDVVHRDIKPGNIMVAEAGEIKILDFGLAKRRRPRDDELLDSHTLTREGQMLGTLPYMSPEQLQGGLIDHRTDIFSFGVVLYEMLAGERPWSGQGWGDLASAILRDAAPPLASRPEPPPRALERLVRRCLEKDVGHRYQSVRELRDELAEMRRELDSGSHFFSGSAARSILQMAPPGSAARRMGSAVIALLAVAVVIAGLVGGAQLWRTPAGPARPAEVPAPVRDGSEATSPKRVAVLPFDNLGPPEEAYFAEGIAEEVRSRLASVSALRVISRRSLGDNSHDRDESVLEGVDFALEGTVRWDPSVGDGNRRARVTPRLVRVSDGAQLWSETYERVIDDLFAVQTEIAVEVIRQMDIVLLEPERRALEARPTDDLEAFQAYLLGMDLAGRRDPSAEKWQRAVEQFEKAVALDSRFALAWAELSEVESFVYHLRLDSSAERLARARRAVDRALAIDPELPQAHRALAYYYYWGLRDYRSALAAFAKAAQSLPTDGQVLGGMAYIARRQGHFAEAAENLRRALEYDPDSAWLAAELARTLRFLRRYREADGYYSRAIALQPDQPTSYADKAFNYLLWHGDLDSAHATLDAIPKPSSSVSILARYELERISGHLQSALDALDAGSATRFAADARVYPVTYLRALVLERQDQSRAAEMLFRAAVSELEAQLEGTADDARRLTVLAQARAHLGQRRQALADARRATELAPISADALVGAQVLYDLAATQAMAGDAEAAVATLERLLAMPAEISRAYLRIEPRWDPIREHPAFARLLEEG